MSRRDWKETEATVFTCSVQEHARAGKVYVPGTGYFDYLITFSYEIDGEWYSGEFNSSTPREEGAKFQLRYDANKAECNEFNEYDFSNNPWLNILLFVVAGCLFALYIWYSDFRHK